jgi:hypothetical protein
MDKQDLIKAMVDMAPTALTIVGAAATSILGLLTFIVKSLWKSHNIRLERLSLSVDRLGQYIKEQEAAIRKENRAIWDSIQELKKDKAVSEKNTENLASHILKLNFTTEEQQKTIQTHIERLIKVDTKLDAVFRFIDTPVRATDNRR